MSPIVARPELLSTARKGYLTDMAMVCSCHAVPERHIVRAIDRGARTIEEVSAWCKAGSTCAGCHDHIDDLLEACSDRGTVRCPASIAPAVAVRVA
jgi:bacterioferritin-associated ferredoxin